MEQTIKTKDMDSISSDVSRTEDQIEEIPVIAIATELEDGVIIPEGMGDTESDVFKPINPELCETIYATVFGMAASLINKDTEVELPASRIKSQGKLLSNLFEKYNVNTDNMDSVLFLAGCAMDYKLMMKKEME